MTVTSSPVFLYEVESGKPVAADLLDAIQEHQLADWETEWVPVLFEAMRRLRQAGVARAHWPQSRHWNWRDKVGILQKMLAYPGFSLVCGGVTQGLMIVDTTTKRCRLEPQKGKPLVYVFFVENAPWNW